MYNDDSNLINKILVNSEVWYGLNETQVNQLETVDKTLLRTITGAHCKTPIEFLISDLLIRIIIDVYSDSVDASINPPLFSISEAI